MAVTLARAPLTTDLTTVAAVREGLKKDTAVDTPTLGRLIKAASAAILQHTNRDYARAQVAETVRGFGLQQLMVSRTPIISLTRLLYQGEVITDATVEDPEAGLIYRKMGTEWTRQYAWGALDSYPVPGSEDPAYGITYWAGYILPGDDVLSEALVASAGAKTYSVPGGTMMPLVVAGDVLRVEGFTTAANNGQKTVDSRVDDQTIKVMEALADEAAAPQGPPRSLSARTLPEDVEQACIETCSAWYLARGRDPAVRSRQVGDLRVEYREPLSIDDEWSAALPYLAVGLLSHYVRVRQ